MKQKFPITFSARDGAFDETGTPACHLQRLRHAVACEPMGIGIAHNSAFAHQIPAYFKLRLDQDNPIPVRHKQRRQCRYQQSDGDEAYVAGHDFDQFSDIRGLQVTRV